MSDLFTKSADVPVQRVSAVEGIPTFGGDILVKRLMEGDEMTALEIFYGKGVGTGLHKHAHESVVHVLKGRLKCVVADTELIAVAGDTCRHPTGVMHSVEALEDSVILEIKSPRPELGKFFKTKG
ncbi:MAG: cupin domain-containing protein [Hyphomicrobiales bacterium]|nr:MAG: cupin domain-containing protein [Hyphomicrobiales bacterium]